MRDKIAFLTIAALSVLLFGCICGKNNAVFPETLRLRRDAWKEYDVVFHELSRLVELFPSLLEAGRQEFGDISSFAQSFTYYSRILMVASKIYQDQTKRERAGYQTLRISRDIVETLEGPYFIDSPISEVGERRAVHEACGMGKNNNQKRVAVKFTPGHSLDQEREFVVLSLLSGTPGFPSVYFLSSATTITQALVMDLLGPSLYKIVQDFNGNDLPPQMVGSIGIQALERIEEVHKLGLVHNDIHLGNMAVGRNGDKHTLYLFDFGLTTTFVNHQGRHIDTSLDNRPIASKLNKKLLSLGQMSNRHGYRRDDIQRLILSLIRLANVHVQWDYEVEASMDPGTESAQICEGLPIQMTTLLEYVRHMMHSMTPHYSWMKGVLREMIEDAGYEYSGRIIYPDERPVSAPRLQVVGKIRPFPHLPRVVYGTPAASERYTAIKNGKISCGVVTDANDNQFLAIIETSDNIYTRFSFHQMERTTDWATCTESFDLKFVYRGTCEDLRSAIGHFALCHGPSDVVKFTDSRHVVRDAMKQLTIPQNDKRMTKLATPLSHAVFDEHEMSININIERLNAAMKTVSFIISCKNEMSFSAYSRKFEVRGDWALHSAGLPNAESLNVTATNRQCRSIESVAKSFSNILLGNENNILNAG